MVKRLRSGSRAGSRLTAWFGAALLAGLALATGAEARWVKVETRHFVLWSDSYEGKVKAYAEQLEGFDWLLRYEHGIKDEEEAGYPKLNLFLVTNHGQLERVSPGLADEVRGFYIPTSDDIAAFAILDDPQFKIEGPAKIKAFQENPIFHEYTHHFMLHYFPFDYPRWLVEGYAEYFGAASVTGPTIDFAKFDLHRTSSLAQGPWLSLEELTGHKHVDLTGRSGENYYPQAWLLTHYMMDDPERRKQLREYMVAVSKGEDPLTALERVTGKSAGDLTSAMRAHLNAEIRYQRLVRKSSDYGPMTVTELPPSADALLLEAERARMGVAISQRPAYVAEVRSRAKRFPGDRLAGIALARAEIEFGDRKAGMAVVEDLLKADPNDVEALCLGGEARVLDGKEAAKTDAPRAKALALEGQGYLGRAFKLNGTRYQTLWMYVEARKLIEPAFPSDNTLDVLLTALDYAPQSPDLRLEAARALVKRKRWTQASNVLGPLIHTPHGDGFVKEAQKLKTEIEQGQTAEAVPAKAG